MNYPNDFETPAFPAGKSIALSRTMAIWIAVVSFLIIAACAILLTVCHVKKNYPFIVATDPLTNDWNVIAYQDKANSSKVQQYQIIQEKLVNDYVTNWFTISSDESVNNKRWETCDETDCEATNQLNPSNSKCLMYCMSGDSVFKDFLENIVPEYKERLAQGNETWELKKLLITASNASEDHGIWQVYAEIHSSINNSFNVLIFIDVARDTNKHPATLGYYIEKFSSYRINLTL